MLLSELVDQVAERRQVSDSISIFVNGSHVGSDRLVIPYSTESSSIDDIDEAIILNTLDLDGDGGADTTRVKLVDDASMTFVLSVVPRKLDKSGNNTLQPDYFMFRALPEKLLLTIDDYPLQRITPPPINVEDEADQISGDSGDHIEESTPSSDTGFSPHAAPGNSSISGNISTTVNNRGAGGSISITATSPNGETSSLQETTFIPGATAISGSASVSVSSEQLPNIATSVGVSLSGHDQTEVFYQSVSGSDRPVASFATVLESTPSEIQIADPVAAIASHDLPSGHAAIVDGAFTLVSINGSQIVTAYPTESTPPPELRASVSMGEDGSLKTTVSASTDALAVEIISSRGNDTLLGGIGDDFLYSGSGQDRFIGGAGADTFVLNTSAPPTDSALIDSIIDFNALEGDKILLPEGMSTDDMFLDSVDTNSDGLIDLTFIRSGSENQPIASVSGWVNEVDLLPFPLIDFLTTTNSLHSYEPMPGIAD